MSYTPLDRLENFLKRYVVYPNEHALTAHVLWIAHTYMMGLWDITPRMGFTSAEPGSGKSRALECSRRVAHNPMPTASITGATFMRQVHGGNYTILIDELEGIYGSAQARDANGTLTSVLNAGFESDAVVHRCEANTHKPLEFKIYAPVMMAGLVRTFNRLPDSLKSRMIVIRMKRRLPSDEIAEFRKRHAEAEAKSIRDDLKEWCAGIEGKIDLENLSFPSDVRDRDKDCWEPLYAIAQAAGSDWLERVIASSCWFVGARTDDSTDSSGLRLLRDCVQILETERTCRPDGLRAELVNMSDAPWSTWGNNGSGLTTFALKQWLKDYGIKPKTVRLGAATGKGYHVEDFKNELARFPAPTEEDGNIGNIGHIIDNKNNTVTDVTDVTAPRGIEEPSPNIVSIQERASREYVDRLTMDLEEIPSSQGPNLKKESGVT
jgi:hypothetical protein